jgi:DnaJ-class molecular chaperone
MRCIAYLEDGRICGRRASHLDIRRGGMVCEYHRTCPSCGGTGRIALGHPSGQRSDWPLDDQICDRCRGEGVGG